MMTLPLLNSQSRAVSNLFLHAYLLKDYVSFCALQIFIPIFFFIFIVIVDLKSKIEKKYLINQILVYCPFPADGSGIVYLNHRVKNVCVCVCAP